MDGGAWQAQSMGSLRVGHDWLHFHFSLSCIGEGNGNPLHWVLAWRIPGTGEPGGLPSMGSHRVGHDWSDLAAAGQKQTGRDKREGLKRGMRKLGVMDIHYFDHGNIFTNNFINTYVKRYQIVHLNMYNSFCVISISKKLLNFGGKRVKGGCLHALTMA